MLKNTLVNIKTLMRRTALLVMAAVFVSSSFVAAFAPSVSAKELISSSVQAATSYAWTDRQTISVTGGSVKAGQGFRVDANDNAPTTGSGIILMTEIQKIQDCPFLWTFCSTEDVPTECYVSMSIALTGLTRGTITAVQTASAGNSDGPQACQKPAWDTYNGKVVNITGTRPADSSGTTETSNQKTVFFVVRSDFKESEAPDSVNIRVTGAATKSLVANKRELNGNITFNVTTTLEPGAYTATVTSPPEGLVVEPKNFTKVKFSQITVNIGDAEGFADRQIEVYIEIARSDPGAKKYGPLVLTLYNAAGEAVKTANSNSVDMPAIELGQLDGGIINLRGTLDDVDAGTYKLCIGSGTSQCQNITKIDGSRLQVQFEITSAELIEIAPAAATGTSCGIGDLAWLICPVLSLMADILQESFKILSNDYLRVDIRLLAPDSGTFVAWSIFRNIANVAFVIVFLIIIFSQMTGAGVTNYGVKKMLPRLIVAAILVNISYYVCQIAVDLSNILGFSLKSVFDGIATASNIPTPTDATGNGMGVVALVGGIVATTAVVYFSLAALIPVLIGAVIAIVMIMLILMARKALVVILIVLAPLAFVAFLLPNTESLFKAWRKMFTVLLLLFPIISIVFGASGLASQIILQANPDDTNNKIIALGVMAIPFFAVPILLKGALDSIGGVGARLNGFASKTGGKLGGLGGKAFGNTRLAKFQEYRREEAERRRELTQSGAYEGRNAVRRGWSNLNKRFNESKRTGKFGDRATAIGAKLENAEDAELLENASAKVTSLKHGDNPLTTAQYIQIARGQDVTHNGKSVADGGRVIMPSTSFSSYDHRAAINQVASVGNVGEVGQLIDGVPTMSRLERKTLGAAVRGSGAAKEAPWLGGESIAAIEQGTATEGGVTIAGLMSGKVTAETLAQGSAHSVNGLLRSVSGMPTRTAEEKAARTAAVAQLKKAYGEYQNADARLRERVVAGGTHDTALKNIATL
jgi:hypothetical protein